MPPLIIYGYFRGKPQHIPKRQLVFCDVHFHENAFISFHKTYIYILFVLPWKFILSVTMIQTVRTKLQVISRQSKRRITNNPNFRDSFGNSMIISEGTFYVLPGYKMLCFDGDIVIERLCFQWLPDWQGGRCLFYRTDKEGERTLEWQGGE